MLLSCYLVCCFCFFKQKTAYEMRISDWSSDVCSSDLERPLLFIKARPSARLSEDAMRTHLSARLDRWCMPDVIEFVEDLPLGATGKVDKKQLRARSSATEGQEKADRKSTRLNSSH